MKIIGGYFGLELGNNHREYYPDLLKFNSARNAIVYVSLKKNYKKLYIPHYICHAVIDSLRKADIELSFYSIDFNLEMECIPQVKENEAILYINYFGLKDGYINLLIKENKTLMIDNAQGFFSKPYPNIDTVYSPRKFFGVPDGGYLSTSIGIDNNIKKDQSYSRFTHLIKRLDIGAEKGYNDFKENDKSLDNEPIKKMSNLTNKLLNNIDYKQIKVIRNTNYIFLHQHLKHLNELRIDINLSLSPLVYPLLSHDVNLREKLIANKVFTATYWPDVLKRCKTDSIEHYFTKNILPLPIDQRYSIEDMKRIISIIL